jgi:oligoendopeptidase F
MTKEQRYEPGRWSLTNLIPSPEGPDLEKFLTRLEEAVAEIEGRRDRLNETISKDEFAEIVALLEEVGAISRRLGAYASLWFAEDTTDQAALAFRGRIEKVLTDVQNRTLFFELWWKGLPNTIAERLLSASGDAAYYLESLRRFQPYTLSEPEEKLINLKDENGVEALVTMYEMLTTRLTFNVEIDGERRSLSRSELMAYASDPSPAVREAIYRELYRVYGEESTILGQIYQHIVRNWADEKVALRRFSSPIAVRNLMNDIPDPVVETLLSVCQENAVLFQRYFRLKAGWLGMKKLRRYDIYAPVRNSERTYPFDEAITTILESLNAFSPVIAAHAKRVLDEGHLDAEIRSGKVGGAFCHGVLPGLTPWVLTNYNGKESDVSTLAHELGHAIHALMAADHSPLTFHSSLPLAETASVFSEILLLERQLQRETDPLVRRDILARFVDGAYATVIRQAYFVLFEREAHELIKDGVTTDVLAERYLTNLNEQFGDAVEVSDEFRWEWVSIPHIYTTPFYCYAYSFGQLLVLSLYRQYKEEGEAFVPKYLTILAHGGSKSPQEILSEAGIDMASASFWRGGFKVLEGMIEDLEDLSRSNSS